MSVAESEAVMARKKGRPARPTGEGTQVRIDSDLVRKARYLAAAADLPLSEYLSKLFRPALEEEFRKAKP